jgi:hypothetical protein
MSNRQGRRLGASCSRVTNAAEPYPRKGIRGWKPSRRFRKLLRCRPTGSAGEHSVQFGCHRGTAISPSRLKNQSQRSSSRSPPRHGRSKCATDDGYLCLKAPGLRFPGQSFDRSFQRRSALRRESAGTNTMSIWARAWFSGRRLMRTISYGTKPRSVMCCITCGSSGAP